MLYKPRERNMDWFGVSHPPKIRSFCSLRKSFHCNGIFGVCFKSEENSKVLKIWDTSFHFDSHKIDADATAVQVVDALGVSCVLLAFCSASNSFSMGVDFWAKPTFRVICFPVKKVCLCLARQPRHVDKTFRAHQVLFECTTTATMQALGSRATFRPAACFKPTQALHK